MLSLTYVPKSTTYFLLDRYLEHVGFNVSRYIQTPRLLDQALQAIYKIFWSWIHATVAPLV